MEDRPTASELLQAVSELLQDEVLPVLEGGLQHKVRVAANLCRIVDRELRLGPDAAEQERLELGDLLGTEGTLPDLNQGLSEALRCSDDDAFLARAADILFVVTERKLAIDKPGYAAPRSA